MDFSEKLRLLIDEQEITQKQIAKELQIPPSTFGGYVQGTSEPDFEILKRIAAYFNVTTDYLLSMQEKQTNSVREAELLRVFRSLSPEQQEIYIEQGKAILRFNAKYRHI